MPFDAGDSVFMEGATRKAEFKEIAREILRKDRECRKYGMPVDTGGSIARALENAYKLGKSHGELGVHTSGALIDQVETSDWIPWNTIPSRARQALDYILRFEWAVQLLQSPDPWDRPTGKWGCYAIVNQETKECMMMKTYGKSTLEPLIKLGLMEYRENEQMTYLFPTQKGVASWLEAIEQGYLLPRNA